MSAMWDQEEEFAMGVCGYGKESMFVCLVFSPSIERIPRHIVSAFDIPLRTREQSWGQPNFYVGGSCHALTLFALPGQATRVGPKPFNGKETQSDCCHWARQAALTLSAATFLPGTTRRAECAVPGRDPPSLLLLVIAVPGLDAVDGLLEVDWGILMGAGAHPCMGGRMERSDVSFLSIILPNLPDRSPPQSSPCPLEDNKAPSPGRPE